MFENSCAIENSSAVLIIENIFVETVILELYMYVFFFQDSLINRKRPQTFEWLI